MLAKGRQKKGAELPQALLTDELVYEFRVLYWEGRERSNQKNAPYSARIIAEMYGLNVDTVKHAIAGKTKWAHVKQPPTAKV